MDLRLATTEDIVDELLQRQIRFVFVAVENTNSGRDDFACLAGKGGSTEEVVQLLNAGRDAIESWDDPPDYS